MKSTDVLTLFPNTHACTGRFLENATVLAQMTRGHIPILVRRFHPFEPSTLIIDISLCIFLKISA